MQWVAEKVEETINLDIEATNALTLNDFDELEAIAEITYDKTYNYYLQVQQFSVSSSDAKKLKEHTTLFFYYHYKSSKALKNYAYYMKIDDPFTASVYADEELKYFDRVTEEAEVIEDILNEHNITFKIDKELIPQ